LALHLPGLYGYYILAALMNGKTDNDCEQNRDACANCNFFPSCHDARRYPGDLSPIEGQLLPELRLTKTGPPPLDWSD
jgi:hypothetical protein